MNLDRRFLLFLNFSFILGCLNFISSKYMQNYEKIRVYTESIASAILSMQCDTFENMSHIILTQNLQNFYLFCKFYKILNFFCSIRLSIYSEFYIFF